MNCSKCGNTSPITCGCETGIPTPPPCGSPNCPDPDPCAETFDSQCIVYTGDDIVCGNTTIVETNTNISDALNEVVNFFCDNTIPVSYTGPDIECTINGDTQTIVESDTPINDALEAIADLACQGASGSIYSGQDIVCNNETVVENGASLNEALNGIVDYFCNTPAPASCICLYEAKVTLTKQDLITETLPTIFGANKSYKQFSITIAANEAIEVVSASYRLTQVGGAYTFTGGTGELTLQISGNVVDIPQFTDGGMAAFNNPGGSGIYLMQEYETVLGVQKPNMALNQPLYAVINGIASSEGTANGTMVITILYKKTTY